MSAAAFEGVTVQPMIKDKGYELIVGSSVDRQFGPVILFGAGGVLVEVFQDSALALPPLNRTLATRLMERTQICQALQGVRGQKPPCDLEALETLLVRFSQLLCDFPEIQEVDLNPMLASRRSGCWRWTPGCCWCRPARRRTAAAAGHSSLSEPVHGPVHPARRH